MFFITIKRDLYVSQYRKIADIKALRQVFSTGTDTGKLGLTAAKTAIEMLYVSPNEEVKIWLSESQMANACLAEYDDCDWHILARGYEARKAPPSEFDASV